MNEYLSLCGKGTQVVIPCCYSGVTLLLQGGSDESDESDKSDKSDKSDNSDESDKSDKRC